MNAVISPLPPHDKLRRLEELRRQVSELEKQISEINGPGDPMVEASHDLQQQASLLTNAERIASIGSWDMDIAQDRLLWSDQVYDIFGLTKTDFDNTFESFYRRIHPEDRAIIHSARRRAEEKQGVLESEFRIIRPNGEVRTLYQRGEVISDATQRPLRRRGMVIDVTDRKRHELLAAGQRQIMELIIQDASLNAVLEAVVRLVEQHVLDSMGSIMLVDRDHKLRWGVGPNLPPGFVSDLNEVRIGTDCGSCGRAAALGQPVIVRDIATDPLCAHGRELALAHGLKACWSMPVFARESEVVGTFAIYYGKCKEPVPHEQEVVKALTHVAGLAITNQRAKEALRSSDQQFASAFEHASIGMALVSPEGRWLKVNHALCQMIGYSETELRESAFQAITHPDDLAADLEYVRQILADEIHSYQMLKRYFHKAGHIVWILLSVSLVRDSEGRPQHFISQVQDMTERKRVEEALRRSEELYRLLFAANPLPMWVYDVETYAYLAVNSAAVLHYGYSEQEFLSMTILDIRPPKEVTRVKEDVQRMRRGGKSSSVWHHIKKSGQMIEVEVSTDEILFKGRDARVVLARDVTDRRRAEAALRASESKFRRLADSNVIGVFFWEWDGGVSEANDAFLHMTGYTQEDLDAGRLNWKTMAPPESRDQNELLLKEIAAMGRGTPHEREYLRKDGARITVLLGAALLEGFTDRGVCFILDVTPRKRAEERIAEQAALLDKAQDAIFVRGLDQEVLFWNQGAERLYGWSAEEVVGRVAHEFLYRDPVHMEHALKVILEKGEWSGELQQLTKDGRDVRVEARWSLLRDANGRPKSILAINTDITERKKLETQFLRAQRMESIGTLAGGIAHDLNNVLAPIMMSIDLLKLRITDATLRETLDLISSSARRGAEMVSQVLYFARGIEGERIAIDTRGLLRDLERFVKEAFPKNIVFTVNLVANLWRVTGDATQIYQVMLNMCVNARDAMPAGGRLSVAVENVTIDDKYAAENIEANSGCFVVFHITDTGTGIPAHVIDKIYDPFFTTKEVGKGTGLGLSTSLAIVKSHGGFLQVYSEPDQGTKFSVYLPAEWGDEPGHAGASQDELLRGAGETILLVDDEASIRHVTSQTLEAFGYRVLTADNGADALAVYATHRAEIALVLTDMMMPVMDGPALIHALRRISPELAIIAASGIGANSHVAKAAGAGVEHFVPKPYTAETLLNMLATVLRGHSGIASS